MKRTIIIVSVICAAMLFLTATESKAQEADQEQVQEEVQAQEEVAQAESNAVSLPRFRIALQGGYGYRLAKLFTTGNSLVDKHNQKLKYGPVYGGDLTYFFSNDFGVGVKFSNMHSKAYDPHVIITDEYGNSRIGDYRDNIDIMYVGPTFAGRLLHNTGNNVFYYAVGVGYVGYKDNGQIIDEVLIKGNTIGFCFDFGYEIRLLGNMFIGLNLCGITGVLYNVTQTMNGVTKEIKLDKDELENLMHVSLSAGLRYYL